MLSAYADQILMAASALFALSLVPTVIRQWRDRACTVPLSSSLPTLAALGMIMAAYASLGLWLATGAAGATALCWAIIAGQRVAYSMGTGPGLMEYLRDTEVDPEEQEKVNQAIRKSAARSIEGNPKTMTFLLGSLPDTATFGGRLAGGEIVVLAFSDKPGAVQTFQAQVAGWESLGTAYNGFGILTVYGGNGAWALEPLQGL